MSDWGKAAKNNSIGFGQGSVNNNINWGKSQKDSSVAANWAGETDISGGSATPPPPPPTIPQIDNLYSMQFDGIYDYIEISNPIEITGDFTISAWIYPTRGNVGHEMIYTPSSTRVGNSVYPYFSIRDTRLQVSIVGPYETGLNFINVNQWQHVAVTRTSGVINLYKNGVEYIGTRPIQNGTLHKDTSAFIGRYTLGGNAYAFQGNIDEVAVYNISLTEEKLLNIYNATAVVDGVKKTADLSQLTTPPIAWYRM